jgi:hypothetical protein
MMVIFLHFWVNFENYAKLNQESNKKVVDVPEWSAIFSFLLATKNHKTMYIITCPKIEE